MKLKNAFTLAESLITIVIIGIIYAAIFNILRTDDINNDVIKKAGANVYYQIDFASKQILAKNTYNYNFHKLKNDLGFSFSITSENADKELVKLFKKHMKGLRNNSLNLNYAEKRLINESGITINNLKVSTFNYGFFISNGAYIAIRLNKNCTTTETYVYSPIQRTNRSATNSCGLIFFDVNGDKEPNTLGIDQYIVPIGKSGVK